MSTFVIRSRKAARDKWTPRWRGPCGGGEKAGEERREQISNFAYCIPSGILLSMMRLWNKAKTGKNKGFLGKSGKKDTSWGKVANWYDDYLESGEDTYQSRLILPNLLRLLSIKHGDKILDLACGQGFFSRGFAKLGAEVTGADISSELIEMARNRSKDIKGLNFKVAPADKLDFFSDNFFDKAAIVLALENIENVKRVFNECFRVLKRNGKFFMVLIHPAFRVPGKSFWGWDEEKKIQYRRIDKYMSESRQEIKMKPGADSKVTTVSFHRPLQFYFKLLEKVGFSVRRLEEWVSDKKSEAGPRQTAENKARREIPMFLMIEAEKI